MKPVKPSVGILAYGSLIANPGDEINAVMTGTKSGVETPFNVEFARSSRERHGAPTLVPVEVGGARVQAYILLLDASVEDATDRLYRREINQVGTAKRYKHSENPGVDTVIVKRLMNFHDMDVVLYTHIGKNIDDLTPAKLAQLAIKSAQELDNGRDGISYLIDAKRHGIKTKLSDAYEEEIKKQLGPKDLDEALRMARERHKKP